MVYYSYCEESIGHLTNLWELYLYKNRVTTLPESTKQLTALWRLDLAGNRSTTFPEDLKDKASCQAFLRNFRN